MTEYIIDEEAYKFLAEWTESRKTATKFCPYWDKRSKVYLKGSDAVLCVDATRYGYKFSLLAGDKSLIAKGKIMPDETCKNDFQLEFDLDKKYSQVQKDLDFYIHCIQVYVTAFIEINCFMWYGNIAETKEYYAAGKNAESSKIITLRKYKNIIYAVPISHHRSPEGVFSVRGHFRHYSKTGKTIWIDEYLKGTEK